MTDLDLVSPEDDIFLTWRRTRDRAEQTESFMAWAFQQKGHQEILKFINKHKTHYFFLEYWGRVQQWEKIKKEPKTSTVVGSWCRSCGQISLFHAQLQAAIDGKHHRSCSPHCRLNRFIFSTLSSLPWTDFCLLLDLLELFWENGRWM